MSVHLLDGSGESFVVETDALTKRFGDRTVVDRVDLRVPRGVAFGYLGPNGAGKTTLIRVLLGLTRASSGSMRLLGLPIPQARAQALARVGAIVEEPRFHPHLTGRENLQTVAAARDRESRERIHRALERVGLAARAHDRVKTYSLGMRQRLGIARCLLADPELLILDEPMNGLDPAGIREFRTFLRSFVAEGRTIMLSSHLLDEVERISDRVAMLKGGHILFTGELDDIKQTHHRLTLRFLDERRRPPELNGVLSWEGRGCVWTAAAQGRLDDLALAASAAGAEIGRASCRERVLTDV